MKMKCGDVREYIVEWLAFLSQKFKFLAAFRVASLLSAFRFFTGEPKVLGLIF